MENLKPCPFCGGEAEVFKMASDQLKMAACIECMAQSRLFLTEDEAIKAWNMRTDT
jgi:Lar family restriction alleviation protein